MFRDEQELNQAIERLHIDAQPRSEHRDALRAKMLAAFEQAASQPAQTALAQLHHWLWRTIMHRKRTRLVAAIAAIIVVGVVSTATFWNGRTSTVYAIEQTIEALRTVRSLHVREYGPTQQLRREAWIAMGERGQVIAMRGQTADGKVTVISGASARIWLPAENKLAILTSAQCIGEIQGKVVAALDPDNWMRMYQDNTDVHLRIEQPKQEGQPIQIVATYVNAPQRTVVQIDSDTKLVKEWSVYPMVEGQYRLAARYEFSELNQPLEPGLFTLQTPAGAVVDDQTVSVPATQDSQADTATAKQSDRQPGETVLSPTEAEAAKDIVRQAVEALMNRDYERLMSLRGKYSRGTINGLRDWWEGNDMEWRILSFGEVTGGEDADGRYAKVPFTLHVRRPAPPGHPSAGTGERITEQWKKLATLAQDPGQPGKWFMAGGL